MKTFYLLPHKFQRYGMWAMYSALIVFIGYFITCMVIAFSSKADIMLNRDSLFVNLMFNILMLLICIGIVLVAFSAEKHEDEMIASIRKDSVVQSAYIIFLIYMAILIVGEFFGFHYLPLDFRENIIFQNLLQGIEQPIIIFALYEVIFRTKLSRLKKALTNE